MNVKKWNEQQNQKNEKNKKNTTYTLLLYEQ